MQSMTTQVTQILEKLADDFGTKKFTDTFAMSYIKAPSGPSDKWSRSNRVLMLIQGTNDARGYRQWKLIGRHVKKDAKAIHILAPRMITRPAKKDSSDDEEPEKIIDGFMGIPVFRVEDTEGDPLPQYKPKNAPNPDLLKLVERRGIKLEWKNSTRGEGGYIKYADKQIVLCSEDFMVLAHELVHLYDFDKVKKIVAGQDPVQETVAELGACVLSQIYGHDAKNETYAYIASYAKNSTPAEVGKMCLKVITRVGDIIDRILVDAAKD